MTRASHPIGLRSRRLLAVLLGGTLVAIPILAEAVPIEIVYADGPNEGFNDPIVGLDRMTALERAVGIWEEELRGEVPIVIEATMDDLGGEGSSALLAVARSTSVHRDFPGAPHAGIYYGAALANQLAGVDVNGATLVEIQCAFNDAVDNATVLGSLSWYYGTDGNAGYDIDFVTIALHEIGHGLGFFDSIDPGSGNFRLELPTTFDTHLVSPAFGFIELLLPAERREATRSANLQWTGPYLYEARGANAPVYAPRTLDPQSSVSHWSTELEGELMTPFYARPIHDPGLLLPALLDMGWNLSAAPTPPTMVSTPTATATPTALDPTPFATRLKVYASSFEEGTVSVINGALDLVEGTIDVGDYPLGLVASPDGRFVYVANFGAESISVIRTMNDTVVAEIPVMRSCYSVALSLDGRTAFVSNTLEGGVSVVDLNERRVTKVIDTGLQPADIALSPDGRSLLVAEYGSNAVSVIDTTALALRARVLLPATAPLGVTVGLDAGTAYATTANSFLLRISDFEARHINVSGAPGAGADIAVSPDGTRAYIVGPAFGQDSSALSAVDLDRRRLVGQAILRGAPAGMGLSPSGDKAYVATRPSWVSVVQTTDTVRALRHIAVGADPAGIAVLEAPLCPGDCDGDGAVSIDEVVVAVSITLATQPTTQCPAVDTNADDNVAVDELIRAVDQALNGCESGD